MYGCTSSCNDPYTEFKKGDCCLDLNKNKVCDKDENSVIKDVSQENSELIKRNQKEDCPFECCIDNEYKIKICQDGYECKNLRCIELDTDSDGLTDLQEKKLGTSLISKDSDSDGLDDAFEVNVKKTSPLSANTDNDRYLDSEDKDPLKPNSAKIEVTVEKIETENADLLEVVANADNKEAEAGAFLGSIIPGIGNVAGSVIGKTVEY